MGKINNSDYTLRISNASPAQFLIICYEFLIDNLDEAMQNTESPDYLSRVDTARGILMELINGLDMGYELSGQLFSIYVYVNELLLAARSPKKAGKLGECKEIMSHLLDGWRLAAESEGDVNSDAVKENATQVYAGLTYGKGGQLNEYSDDGRNRGYKA
jgi:flagellar protein FliS